jgi:uncharacterized protein (TIGR02001 family)
MLTSIRGLAAATLLASTMLAATPAFADETDPPSDITVTGSAAVVSSYRFRGLAQSDNKPAIQAAITVTHSSGLYVGTWGSSASAGSGPIDIGGTEIDVFGGFAKQIGTSGVTVDVGVYGYVYPGATFGNYYEIYGSVAKSLGPVSAKVGVYYAPAQKVFNYNWTSSSRHNTYVYGDLSTGIPGTPLSVHGHLGHTGGGFDWAKDYLDYNVGVTYKWKMLALDLSLVGTNVSKSSIDSGFLCGTDASCIDYFHRMSKPIGVLSLSASF